MPYIKQKDRKRFTRSPQKLGPHSSVDLLAETGKQCSSAGDLNYAFTVIAQHYLKTNGLNYQHINDCIGALEGCKLELYRRIAVPYEDLKVEENGDVKGI